MMKHFMLIYSVSDDYMQRRAEFRAEHLKLAWEWADEGKLLLGGALMEPVDTAMLLFFVNEAREIISFVEDDPYVKNGLVKSYQIREWTTVVGNQAATPVR